MDTSAKGCSYNAAGLVCEPVNFNQTIIPILLVLGSRGKNVVRVLVQRQEVLVDALAKREVGLCHIGAVIVVESAGADVFIRKPLFHCINLRTK